MLTQILIIILICISMILILTLILIFRDSGSDAEGYPWQADSSANSLQRSSPQLCWEGWPILLVRKTPIWFSKANSFEYPAEYNSTSNILSFVNVYYSVLSFCLWFLNMIRIRSLWIRFWFKIGYSLILLFVLFLSLIFWLWFWYFDMEILIHTWIQTLIMLFRLSL